MKIGILTFHSQLNYGGVLQAAALSDAIAAIGHAPVVIDRWLDPENHLLLGAYGEWRFKQWAKFFLRCACGMNDRQCMLRRTRTRRFIANRMSLTPYHFHNWIDAPRELGVDAIVVGSDQVWHSGDWNDPGPYFLDGAPDIPAIAYAASFGMKQLPEKAVIANEKVCGGDAVRERYIRGLERFGAISCRESQGVDICRDLGCSAVHVVDPVLLKPVSAVSCDGKRDIVCYFLSEPFTAHIAELESFATRHDCRCRILVDLESVGADPFPCNRAAIRYWADKIKRKFSARHVSVEIGAGPQEFLDCFASARYVVSDSFHAFMFAIRNGADVRILSPKDALRKPMFARIEEFAGHFSGAYPISASVRDALASFDSVERPAIDMVWLENFRQRSLAWLENAIKTA